MCGHRLTVAVGAALLLLTCTLSVSCARRARPTAPGENVFTFNNGAEPETLDPALMTGVPEHTLAMALFEGLVGYHPQTLKPVPAVAERWEVSTDAARYTFHLRNSAWSNGDPVTADDFVYAWRRVLEPATAAEYAYQLWYIKNARAYTKGELKDFSLVGIRTIDHKTVEVTLENPTPYFLELTAFETYMPVHRGCVDKHAGRWTRPENIVGNGPFILDQWKPHDRIVLRRNPRYWDAASVKLDRIVALAIVDENTALRRYKAGGLDWLNALPAAMIPALKTRPDYHKAPYLGTYFYRFNCTRKPFDDPRVRKAFNLAIDKAAICRDILNGQYEPATALVPPMMPPYDPPKGPTHDRKLAAELLAQAGYPGGKGFPRVTLIYNTSRRHEEIAVVAQDMWKRVLGIDVNLVNQEWKVYLRTMTDLDFDIVRSAWIGDYMDPNTFLDMFVTGGGNNRTGWSNRRYDDLIAEAARTVDAARRLELLRTAESILVVNELPILPLYYYSSLSLRRPCVKGFYPNPRDLHPFKCLDLAAPEPAGS